MEILHTVLVLIYTTRIKLSYVLKLFLIVANNIIIKSRNDGKIKNNFEECKDVDKISIEDL